jgi:hypothetical protein
MVPAPTRLRLLGLVLVVAYAALIVWLYAAQPRSLAELRGGVAGTVGAYTIDHASFAEGLRFFRNDQFVEARSAFARADPAQRDPTTQFYVAYSFLRQGWGRLYHDEALYREGLRTVERAAAASPTGQVRVDDAALALRTTDELKAELERGLRRDVPDLNRLRGARP